MPPERRRQRLAPETGNMERERTTQGQGQVQGPMRCDDAGVAGAAGAVADAGAAEEDEDEDEADADADDDDEDTSVQDSISSEGQGDGMRMRMAVAMAMVKLKLKQSGDAAAGCSSSAGGGRGPCPCPCPCPCRRLSSRLALDTFALRPPAAVSGRDETAELSTVESEDLGRILLCQPGTARPRSARGLPGDPPGRSSGPCHDTAPLDRARMHGDGDTTGDWRLAGDTRSDPPASRDTRPDRAALLSSLRSPDREASVSRDLERSEVGDGMAHLRSGHDERRATSDERPETRDERPDGGAAHDIDLRAFPPRPKSLRPARGLSWWRVATSTGGWLGRADAASDVPHLRRVAWASAIDQDIFSSPSPLVPLHAHLLHAHPLHHLELNRGVRFPISRVITTSTRRISRSQSCWELWERSRGASTPAVSNPGPTQHKDLTSPNHRTVSQAGMPEEFPYPSAICIYPRSRHPSRTRPFPAPLLETLLAQTPKPKDKDSNQDLFKLQ
ncbi:hypothetical protein B2J93_7094 [Marssonina coronariae]|uniref:Uncharacterized protein n=1 Tax=Diplocarpon coronariae TaxID=2795749 RepID=A0A218YUP6_9HELO|nr:hypothetical protein B2J93_7094 [Marssonina coronariae]